MPGQTGRELGFVCVFGRHSDQKRRQRRVRPSRLRSPATVAACVNRDESSRTGQFPVRRCPSRATRRELTLFRDAYTAGTLPHRAGRAGDRRERHTGDGGTTPTWHRDGWEPPENNYLVSVAPAHLMRRCFNSAGYRGPYSRNKGGKGPQWRDRPWRRPECGENGPAEADVTPGHGTGPGVS